VASAASNSMSGHAVGLAVDESARAGQPVEHAASVDKNGVDADASESSLHSGADDDWEVLSDRRAGSVRSLSSLESGSVPSKAARTRSGSCSTVDSFDNKSRVEAGRTTAGTSINSIKAGVLGVDYLEHVVLPSDTLQGICLAYKISSQKLRQANCFSGNTLLLAPKKLVIPISPQQAGRVGFGPIVRGQDTESKEYKIHALLAGFPDLSVAEAKACVPSPPLRYW
jgi:LysM repeat protein